MVKKKEKQSNWWKYLIVLTFIISVSCLTILCIGLIPEGPLPPEYEYEMIHIELNDSNDFTDVRGEVIDYLCDENVEFSNHGNAYYASTVDITLFDEWEYRGYGECMIKVRRIKDAVSEESE